MNSSGQRATGLSGKSYIVARSIGQYFVMDRKRDVVCMCTKQEDATMICNALIKVGGKSRRPNKEPK
jgi:hypothetical protein